ncbi:MATE family efflux transporter [Sedimentitalea arenosa]|jgi:MATE family multidrug resistance protein|uniref:MATE family efflux transporter n=1 Tax=Sedimentitalea arenosa TaxID=2798803 RepID=A0A8J7LRM8_9RHOB|nr:MATE family efflux transporter [Arenibacterium arenosum]MBJ6371049.1 MATE family efflux transporter [Arenibacterium arenosum]
MHPAAAEQAGPITHRRVLNIAIPIVLSNATVPILGAVDTGVVGQMGQAAPIGAVGIGAIIISSLYWIFGFLRMGTTGLTSQAHGAGRSGEVTALLTRAILFGAAAGVALILLQLPLFWAAFRLSPASAEVESLARDYMAIRVWSAPAAIAIFGATGWLIALERTRGVLVLQLWMNGLNVALDFWFVLGLGWGVQGVAFATFLAEWSGFAMALWLCRDAFRSPAWRDWPRIFDKVRLLRMLSVNGDILIRSLMLMGIFVSFLFLGSDFGDVTLAANHILLQFIEITAYALDGFAFSAEALVGQAVGAASVHRLRRAILISTFWALVGTVMLSMAFALWGGALVDLMAKVPAVQAEARVYLPYMVLVPVLGVASWMLDGVFIGATRTRDMRNMAILSTAAFAVAAALLVPAHGNHGLWIAFLFSFVARALTLAARYPALERATRDGAL